MKKEGEVEFSGDGIAVQSAIIGWQNNNMDCRITHVGVMIAGESSVKAKVAYVKKQREVIGTPV